MAGLSGLSLDSAHTQKSGTSMVLFSLVLHLRNVCQLDKWWTTLKNLSFYQSCFSAHNVVSIPKLSAPHSANSSLADWPPHWLRPQRPFPLIGRFEAAASGWSPAGLSWQSEAGIHLFKHPTGPFVRGMVHLGPFERFSGGAGDLVICHVGRGQVGR